MAMTVASAAESLRVGDDGVVRIGGTRVTLDTLVAAFREGAMAEEFVQQYPSVELADAYTAIGYYLHHRGEVDGYLERRDQFAEEVRWENERRFDPCGVRARLLARQNAGR